MSGAVNIATFILDDDQDLLEIIGIALQKTNIKNYQLFNQEDDFLESLTDEIHVCVVDHKLTRRSGLDIVRIIKQHNPKSYIIIYTGTKSGDVILSYWKSGADTYIVKEADLSELPELEQAIVVGLEQAKERSDIINWLAEEKAKRVS